MLRKVFKLMLWSFTLIDSQQWFDWSRISLKARLSDWRDSRSRSMWIMLGFWCSWNVFWSGKFHFSNFQIFSKVVHFAFRFALQPMVKSTKCTRQKILPRVALTVEMAVMAVSHWLPWTILLAMVSLLVDFTAILLHASHTLWNHANITPLVTVHLALAMVLPLPVKKNASPNTLPRHMSLIKNLDNAVIKSLLNHQAGFHWFAPSANQRARTNWKPT